MRSDTGRFVRLGLLAAMAVALNLVESMYIGSFAYGIRIGLANIMALITIRMLGVREMIIVNLMRVVIGSLLRGMIFGTTFWISLGGVALSSLSLILTTGLKSSLLFSSVVSSVCHSIGQVLIVVFLYHQPAMAAVLPYLLLGSVPVGLLTGYAAQRALKLVRPLENRS